MTEKQKTLNKQTALKGFGLHSGKEVNVTIKPAPVSTGYVFKRMDIEGCPEIRALAEHVTTTDRGTTIEENGASVMTIEHLCASLYASQIDNALIELDGPEVPILNGSAEPFIKAIQKTGVVDQEEDKVYFTPTEKISYAIPDKDIELIIYPDDKFTIDVHIDYNSNVLGFQYASLQNLSDFASQIANSKTFVFLHELEPLLKNNLIKGGDLENALIIIDKQVSQEELDRLSELFHKPKVQVMPEGILNNTQMHYPNEPARHKLLDVIGDLSLIGMPLKAKVIAKKPGHLANTELAKLIRKDIKKQLSKPKAPFYDPNQPPLFDIKKVQEYIPHRPPFLLVDKITYMDEWVITGIKNVTMNEAFFAGHYPEEPIMPAWLLQSMRLLHR
jgi:UDP-3-O-[3-hydroxymyristoyl] N-acetylglucosamine deacetylase/3-hydroxyacyl-[acyl-carrier-protein] dehydratase